MTYRDAGVDLVGADRHVAAIASMVTSTWTDNVVGGFGGFAAGVTIPAGYSNPVLMMSTDGVGTKLELARRSGLWDGVGYDLVAMCVDDLAAVGAQPLGFVDYMAVGSLQPERDTAIVASIARACVDAGCALLGGETAEHPGVMDVDAVDLAGAVMGVVERDARLAPDDVAPDDVVIGLRSPNLRSNGFSLVRRVMGDTPDYARLLEPSVIYSPAVLAVAPIVKAAAHITGGGLPANLPRAVPASLGVEVDTSTWQPPEIFVTLSDHGIAEEEMFATFNMGIGFCLIVDPAAADEVTRTLTRHEATVIGRVTPGGGFTLK
ncbi:MAG: phosphoribosylformylglycinamidine cyclo-ligase [Acidimicrobiia bacterium]